MWAPMAWRAGSGRRAGFLPLDSRLCGMRSRSGPAAEMERQEGLGLSGHMTTRAPRPVSPETCLPALVECGTEAREEASLSEHRGGGAGRSGAVSLALGPSPRTGLGRQLRAGRGSWGRTKPRPQEGREKQGTGRGQAEGSQRQVVGQTSQRSPHELCKS